MKMRLFAAKGMMILFLILGLSLFFSNTLRVITTAKVVFLKPVMDETGLYSQLPASAIHVYGDDRYVYSVRETKSPLGAVTYTAHEIHVTVRSEEGTNIILGENLSAFHIAYMEDRELEDGCAVMGY